MVGELPRRLYSVMRRLSRAKHRDGVFVAVGERAFDVKHEGRIVNFAEHRRILASVCVMTRQPKSAMRLSSAARSMDFSQS